MTGMFCPEGFILVTAATVLAAHFWFPAQLERAVPALATSDGSNDAAVQALLQLNRAEWSDPLRDALAQTQNRLRNNLHQGNIKTYYFSEDGRQSIGQDFWATSEADGALETGFYWPDGEPSATDERPPTTLFFMQSELHALFSKPPGKKKHLPESKKLELVQALRSTNESSRM
jgi:hypothetical protein